MQLSLQDAVKKYGSIVDGKWADESKWMVIYSLPDYVQVINQITKQLQKHIYCNKDIIPSLNLVFQALKDNNCLDELKTFSGCFIIRDVRGMPGHPSTHSYGLALDWRADEMPLGANSLFSDAYVKCWKDNGWTWGGDFKRKDPQHVSFAWE